MALTSWPSTPPGWLLPWEIWRYRGEVHADRPTGTPAKIPAFAWEVNKWVAWRRKGALPPRPDITAKPPQGYWGVLKQLNIACPIAPGPPPPPPPNPIPLNSWSLPSPFMMTAWGHRTDSDFRNVEVAAARMVDAGVRTVGLQIGQFEPDVPARYRAFGLKVALWGRADPNDEQALDDADADGYVPQVEGFYEFEPAIDNLENGIGDGLSISIVTTLAGLETYTSRPNGTPDGASTTVEVERLIDAGCTHAWVECYTGDMQPRDVGTLVGYSAGHRGIYHANPVVGLARSEVSIASYRPDLDPYGRQIGVYLAEPMQNPRDWDDLRTLGA